MPGAPSVNMELALPGEESKQVELAVELALRACTEQPNANSQCSICLEEVGATDVVQLQCSHAYHRACVVPWLRQLRGGGPRGEAVRPLMLCPMCKQEVPHVYPPLPRVLFDDCIRVSEV